MTELMWHRGPTDRGTLESDGVALGVRRLSIIDPAGGHQPVANEDRTVWAVQNGELYNHEELRDELRRDGHTFTGRCDTEVIPHLYERDGVAFERRLSGEFAIAVWDSRRRRGVLARDPVGVKPLYYLETDRVVAFASELKSLLASGLVDGALDLEALDAYLTLGFVPGPRTPLAGVRKLMPGTRLVIDPDGVREERYWEYPRPAPDEHLGEQEAGRQLLAELEASVRRRLMSDVPLGAMLSGGLDSSLIVALMSRHASGPVKTFSVGFSDGGRANELEDARLVAEALGTEHHVLELSLAEPAVGLEELAWWLDEPLADLSALGFLALSQLAASEVTVALSGQGADELLGGYGRYRRAVLVADAHRLPRPARVATQALLRQAGGRYARFADTIDADCPAALQLGLRAPWVSAQLHRRLARDGIDGLAALRAIAAHTEGLEGEPLASSMYLDAKLGLVDDMIHYFDRTSMAMSLEVRVPFLDTAVIELCSRLTGRQKARRLRTKHLLRQVARGLIPDSIIDKPKIGFFNSISRRWMAEQLRGPAAGHLLRTELACEELLDGEQVRRMARAHLEGRPADLDALHVILMLEVWLTSVLPRALMRAEPLRERIRLTA